MNYLPKVILISLSEQFLGATEMKRLGQTDKLIFISIKNCKIHPSHQTQLAGLRFTNSSQLQCRIGRWSSLVLTTADELKELSDWCIKEEMNENETTDTSSPLKNIQRLQLLFKHGRDDSTLTDIHLPPNLLELRLNGDSSDFLPLNAFILPSSLTRIQTGHLYSAYRTPPSNLAQIKWPSNLKHLIHISGDDPFEKKNWSLNDLVLPDGLLNLSFATHDYGPQLDNVILPHSLTNLELMLEYDYSFDKIVLPTSLKRLLLEVFPNGGDFPFPSWKNLPMSCDNIQLWLRTTYRTKFKNDGSVSLKVPKFIKKLSIKPNALCESEGFYFLLDLSESDSLTSLLIPRRLLKGLTWSSNPRCQIKHLKLEHSSDVSYRMVEPILPHELPQSLDELDLSHRRFWEPKNAWTKLKSSDWLGVIPANLRTIKLNYYSSTLLSTMNLPTTLTSLSFEFCEARWNLGPGVKVEELKPPGQIFFPNLQLVILGRANETIIKDWSVQLPETKITGYKYLISYKHYYVYLHGQCLEQYLQSHNYKEPTYYDSGAD